MKDQVYPMFSGDQSSKRQEKIHVEKIIAKAAEYWALFVVCIIVSLLCAYLYLRYSTSVYKVQAKILIKDEKKGGASEGHVFEELGINNATSNVENEIEIFKSRVLMEKVVKDLQVNIHYYVPGRIQETELYKESPFRAIPVYNDSSLLRTYMYTIKQSGENKPVVITDNNKQWTGNWGDTLNLTAGKIVLAWNDLAKGGFKDVEEYILTISPVESTADNYRGVLEIGAVNKQVSIINLVIKDNLPKRGVDVLNKLIEVYLQANTDDKNKISDGTLAFIDDRLGIVNNELKVIEKQIEYFKKTNGLTNIQDQSKLLVDNTGEYGKQLTEYEVKLNILESLEIYLQKHPERIVPSVLSVQDAALTRVIENYNTLQAQKENLAVSSTESNPYVKSIDKQLRNLGAEMKNNLASLKAELQITINELKKRSRFLTAKIGEVPEKERIFLEYSRQQNIEQELYLFLLKKREETAISRSATIANARVMEPARREGGPVSPKRSEVFLIALAIGILLPGSWVLAKELFSIKVKTREDITGTTDMPIIGEIGHNEEDKVVAISNDSRTIVSEQFRTLRTNLQFLLTGKDEKVVMITSSMGGEGKSFISINLSSTLALLGKKIVLLELDLRKPKISQHLGINNSPGFSDFAIGRANLEDIIVPSGISDNFYVIPSGSIPPNPAELMVLPQITDLFNVLKEKFDYIVLDTAPVGLVTDAQLLSRYSDAVLFIIRQGYTYKQQVRSANELYHSGKMPAMSIVINDIKMGWGSAYGYGYGNGYYAATDNNNGKTILARKIKRLKNRITNK